MTVALITGGTRGIGLAMTRAMQVQGIQVAVAAKSNFEPDCDLYIQADLSKLHERHGIIQRIIDELGGIDILVNNAGAQTQSKFVEYTTTQFKYDYELMVAAAFDLSQQAAKWMLSHGGGHIVNVLSTAAFQGARNISGYVVAKHALLGLTRAMAVELAPKIRVNAIAPGLITTDMTSNITLERKTLLESLIPAERFGDAAEVAEALVFLINSSYIYGQTITVDGGWCAKNSAGALV